MSNMDEYQTWKVQVKSNYSFFDFDFKELIEYRDLLLIMVYRDFKASYKQTVLGPLWFFLQPLVNSFAYYFIFGKVISIDFEQYNPIHFYLTGVIFWNLFSSCTTLTSNVFISNSGIFKKVYFPRLIAPMAIILSALMRFLIQFIFVFTAILFSGDCKIDLSLPSVFFLVFSVIATALFGMSIGLMFANFSRKYRDLNYILSFSLQLFMFVTPILYPISIVGSGELELLKFNPLLHFLQSFRSFFFGDDLINMPYFIVNVLLLISFSVYAILTYNKSSRNFVDTI